MPNDRRKRNPSWDISRSCLDPLVDIRESKDEIVVTADLPCVKKKDIEVRVKEKALIIEAQMSREMRFESWGGAHRKASFNSFRKNMTLPHAVDTENVEASFNQGILEVRLNKKKKGREERKIDIK